MRSEACCNSSSAARFTAPSWAISPSTRATVRCSSAARGAFFQRLGEPFGIHLERGQLLLELREIDLGGVPAQACIPQSFADRLQLLLRASGVARRYRAAPRWRHPPGSRAAFVWLRVRREHFERLQAFFQRRQQDAGLLSQRSRDISVELLDLLLVGRDAARQILVRALRGKLASCNMASRKLSAISAPRVP